jgi:hypothetical protein
MSQEKRKAEQVAVAVEHKPPGKRPMLADIVDNTQGRLAICHALGFEPALADIRAYESRVRNRDPPLFLWDADTTEQMMMTLIRQLAWCDYCPSTMSRAKSPERHAGVSQLKMEDRLRFCVITGLIQCDWDVVTEKMTPKESHVRTKQNLFRLKSEPGVLFIHGDLRGVDAHRTACIKRLNELKASCGWEARFEENPTDMPVQQGEFLPVSFFSVDGDVPAQTREVLAVHKDLVTEAGRPELEVDDGIIGDYREWLECEVGKYQEDPSQVQAIFRAIGIAMGDRRARQLVAEFYCAAHDQLETRLLLNLYGQSFFPSVFMNLADLRKQTLELSQLPEGGLEWCF